MKKTKKAMVFLICSVVVLIGSIFGYQWYSGTKATPVADAVNYHPAEHNESYFEQLLNQEENQLKSEPHQLTESIMLTRLTDVISMSIGVEQEDICRIYNLVRINIKNTGTIEQQFTEETFRYSSGEEESSINEVALNKVESEKYGVYNIAAFPFILAPNESKDVVLAFTYNLQGNTLPSSASDAEKAKYRYYVNYYLDQQNGAELIKLPFSGGVGSCIKIIREKN